MPSKCFVPGCRSNYNASSKFRIFSFPRDEDLKKAWLKAINREDKREPSKSSKICERHFTPEDIVTEASFFNSITKEVVRVPLLKHRLQQNATPSIFQESQRTRKRKQVPESSVLGEIPIADIKNNQSSSAETDSSHSSAKMRTCCVPGCGSNRKKPYVSTFTFPKSSAFRNLWLKKIGRPFMNVKEHSGVCLKHFEKKFIIDRNDGGIRKRIGIKPGAVPTIFLQEDDANLSDDSDKSQDITKSRGRKCCALGCRSNYDGEAKYTNAFTLPKDPERRRLWLHKINRENFTGSSTTVLCVKHFEERFIIREDRVRRDDGSELVVRRKKLALTPDAYPTIFENVPMYSSTTSLPNNPGKNVMKNKDLRSASTSEASKESADELIGSPISEQVEASPTTDHPLIEVVKPDDFETEEPSTTEEVFDDISPVMSSPISKPDSASKSSNRSKNNLQSPYKHLPPVSVCLNDEDRMTSQKEIFKANKRSLSTCSNSSIGSSETPRLQPKRRKIEKPAPTVIGKQNDCYCWVCHRENVVLNCIACPRAYHQKCAGDNGNALDWVCSECRRGLDAENVDFRSSVLSEISLDKLCTLLRFSLNKMKHRAGVAFLQPVSLEHYPMYLHYVIHPMDFSLLEKNIKDKIYGCTEAFLSDVKWILHNSCVFNGSQHPLSTNAKSIVKACDNDMQEIEVCPDCFMHNIVRNKYWFSEVCHKPHPLVWAKLKGFPYWPAKIVRILDGNVDARFFGAHDRAWVPISQCYHLSKEMPTSSKPKKKGNYETALDELNVHVQLLIQKYGAFEYAPYRTVFDPENKHLTFEGVNTDLAAKDKIQIDIASSECSALNKTEVGTSALKELAESKDTEQTKISVDGTSKVTSSDASSHTEKESKKLSEKELQSEAGQSSSSKPSPSRSDAFHRKKMEMALQRIKGYITNDMDEEKDSAMEEDQEKKSGKDDGKDSIKLNKEKDSIKLNEEKDSSKLNEEKDSEKKSLSTQPDSKDDESSDQDDKEDDMCLSDLIKARTRPPIDLSTFEECSEKETPAILDTTKKNDSFSLKLIETIESCKAKLGISGDLDKSDSDSAEEEEDKESEDGRKQRKLRRRLLSMEDSTEEDSSDETSSDSDDSSSDSDDDASVSSNTDIEIVTELGDAAIGKETEKVSEDMADVAAPETSEKETLSKDANSSVPPVNISVSGEKQLLVTTGEESTPEVENSGNSVACEIAPTSSIPENCNDDKCIPIDKENAACPSPAARSRSVSSNALQSSTDDLTDTDMQMDAIENPETSELDKTPAETDTSAPAEVTVKDPSAQWPNNFEFEDDLMEDDDIYICPPVKPPTPPLICLDDGTETEPEPEDDVDNDTNKSKSLINSPHSRTLPPPEEEICPENTAKYVSILKNAKLIPQNARKSSNKRTVREVSSEDSSDEEMEIITRPSKVPTSGAIRTFNRERHSPQVNNSQSEHQFPVQSEANFRSGNSSTAAHSNRRLARNYEESDQEEIPDAAANVTISTSDLAQKDAEIVRLKKKLGCIFSAFQLQQWKSAQEKTELRHNMNLVVMEMRVSLEMEKKRAIEQLTRKLEREKQQSIDETKKKQWCAFCKLESRYACCWNTSYCTIACQKRHIAEHRHFCTQLKGKPNDVEVVKPLQTSTVTEPKEGKKVLVLNVLPKKDVNLSKNTSQDSSQQMTVSKLASPSIPLHLVSTPSSQSNSSVQYMLTSVMAGTSTASQKPTTSKTTNSDSSEINNIVENKSDSSASKNHEHPSALKKNAVEKEEPSLEEIYFPSPPTICFEGLDTALPDENVHFGDLKAMSESHASDNELTIAEESSAEEDLVLSENDEVDNEMVCIGRGIDVKAKYLNKCLIYGKDAKKLTRCLIDVIFPDTLLAMCSAFGNKSNVTKLTRAALPFKKVEAIIDYVLKRFPSSTRSEITLAINMKCKEARVSVGRAESGGKTKKTLFRRLLAKEQQQDAKEQKQDEKSKPNTKEQTQDTKDPKPSNTPVPEVPKPKPQTKLTLFKNPLPGVVCLKTLSSVAPTSTITTSTSGKTPAGPNILRMGRQILIRPKYTIASPGGPSKVMFSSPSTSPSKTRAPTVRSLLNMQQPLASLSKEKSKLLFPLEMLQKAVVANPSGNPEAGNASASQRPYIIVGSSALRPIAPNSQQPSSSTAPKK